MPVDENTGLPLNPDKTVTVYHHTNKTAAEAIRRTGVLKSAGEPDVYVTTEKSPTTGYGDEVVAIKIDPKKLQIDDQFPDGRTDFRLSVGKPGGSMKVTVDSSDRFMPVADPSVRGAYSFTGGYRAILGNQAGKLRIYGPSGSLIGVASNLEEAQKLVQRKAKQ